MAQKEPTSNPKGVCEKLFNAFSVNPTFRSFRRISHQPQTPTPVAPTPPPPPPPAAIDYNASTNGAQNKPNTLGKNEQVAGLGHTHVAQNKVDTVGKNEPVMGFGHTHKPEKSKVVEAVVPPKGYPQLPQPLTPKNEKEKLTTAPVPTQEKVKSQVAKVNSKTEPASPFVSAPTQGAPGKAEDTIKTRSNSINDKASDYITRAKTKLRTTTTTTAGGVGRFTSFK